MSTKNDKHPTTGRVEVVADQSDDGTFELRVERPSGSHTVVAESSTTERVAAGSVSNLKASESPPEPSNKSRKLAIAAGGLAAAGIAGVFAATVGGNSGPTVEPPVVEPEPAETFQAFTIQTPSANLPRAVLAADVGADTVEEPEATAQQSPVSPPPPEQALEPEAIPSPNPAAQMDPTVARQLQNVRVSAEPVAVLGEEQGNDDEEYDEYDEYDDDEYDEYDDDDDDEYNDDFE